MVWLVVAVGGALGSMARPGVSGSRTSGVIVNAGASTVTLASSDVVSNNCQHGILVQSPTTLLTGATVRNNGINGVFAGPSSNIFIQPGSVISGNGTTGVNISGPARLTAANAEVSSNGATGTGVFGGIVGNTGAAVAVLQGANVMNNTGSGIHLSLNSRGFLGGAAIVERNSAGGLNLIEGAVARLENTLPGGIPLLRLNGGGSTGDVNCDAYSQVFGDVSGVSSNKCQIKGGGE